MNSASHTAGEHANRASRLPAPLARLIGYSQRHGLGPLFGRTLTITRRALFQSGYIVYACDLQKALLGDELRDPLRASCVAQFEDLRSEDWSAIVHDRTASVCRAAFLERFAEGALLWLIYENTALAGYGWTIVGRTLQPFYHPLTPGEAHLFDFMILPGFRGKSINPRLVNHILRELAREGRIRAYIDMAGWNAPQIASLKKTAFQRIGFARRLSMFGWTLVAWAQQKS